MLKHATVYPFGPQARPLTAGKQGTDIIDLRWLLERVIYGMDPFSGLRGRYGLQTPSEVRSDLKFENSDLNYLHIHVHIAYLVWTLLTASEATMTSKQPWRSDLTSDLK